MQIDPIEVLRTRRSVKWSRYGPQVLPLFVAEMDYPVAAPIRETLTEMVAASDLGYAMAPGRLGEAFAGFAARRWGWQVQPDRVRTTTDVATAIVEVLRQAIRPGDGVVITPPIYPPFYDVVPEAGGTVVEVPLTCAPHGWDLDIAGIEAALSSGRARAVLIANPHNPLGVISSRLVELSEVAARHGAVVVADEIHGPLTQQPGAFTPFLSVGPAARQVGVCVTSASKSWNLAGTKCAVMVAASSATTALLDSMYDEVGFRTSLLGLHANITAFSDPACEAWLDDALSAIAESSALLSAELAEHLPEVVYEPGAATYLAWLDFRALPEWGDDPSELALHRGVAINPGPSFGTQGRGFARLNLASAPEVIGEAVRRLAG
ncbi:MAG: MalY/PatB family protein [Nocardioides sp.]